MKSAFVTWVVVGFVLLGCKESGNKSAPLNNPPTAASKHSASFNAAIDSALSGYYQLTEALVQWDSSSISSMATNIVKQLKEVDISGAKFENDSQQKEAAQYLAGLTSDIHNISTASNLEGARRRFHTASENLAQFLQFIKYDNQKLFLQECPMAFNDEETATWISAAPEIRNPYLGLHHPRYKSGMLHCGTTKTEVNYTGTK